MTLPYSKANSTAISVGLTAMVSRSNCCQWDTLFIHDIVGGLHQLPIETVLSKSFSLSSYSEQSQIIPYYYKSAMNMTGEDITIVTLVTRNRIPNLARLATQYQGTIQGNLHIK